ncbi:3-dehydroquinate synthase [Ornithobacterium rhinotracheale]|uniref:3-dehydroquinate synthase n=1 Tax=Ornithobacterium rhinotracheale TaxID=28251 RepID=A0A3R5YWF3_ORNRH|nr:3-dehydroquinate synthase family protein [Ornithobacterium rhinotracheale]QAR31080.1 3-dehydroquinate synthase [Ornithobacterium rhinotracheale]
MTQAPIYFDQGFEALDQLIAEKNYSKIMILVDENTHEKCLPLLLQNTENILNCEFIEIPAGEDTKQLFFVNQVLKSLKLSGLDRKSLLINLGGGVVTDFGGFVASIYNRGIDFVNIPTSLLAMVDASAGGKTGVDLCGIKNIVGTFSQPQMVIIETEFLKTLPPRELLSGFAEMLKHGLIQDENQWKTLSQITKLDAENIAPHIKNSINVKLNVVTQDPTEKGLRKILNAGHTLGHAIETYYLWLDKSVIAKGEAVGDKINHFITQSLESDDDFSQPILSEKEGEPSITHGEAVATGLMLEAHLAWQKGFISKEEFSEIFYRLTELYPYFELPSAEILEQIMLHDKKNEGGKINFVMLRRIGECTPDKVECSRNEIQNAIDFYTENFPK